jgi:hypothetical protein
VRVVIQENIKKKRDRIVIPDVNRIMMPFRGLTSWAKMTSPRGKLTSLACYLTKKVNTAEELTIEI